MSNVSNPFDASKAASQLWYKTHKPSDKYYTPFIFLTGLTAIPNDTTIATLNKIFTAKCAEYRIWELPLPIHDENSLYLFYEVVAAISKLILEKFPNAPQYWVDDWIRIILLEAWQNSGEAIFKDANLYGDIENESFQPLFRSPKPRIPLQQTSFVLTVSADAEPGILELVSSRCLEPACLGKHPSDDKLSLFYSEFQSLLEEKVPGTELSLKNGTLQWIRNNLLEPVENQHDFEIAVTHLYHVRSSGCELYCLLSPDGENAGEESKEVDKVKLPGFRFSGVPRSKNKAKGKEKEKDEGKERVSDERDIEPKAGQMGKSVAEQSDQGHRKGEGVEQAFVNATIRMIDYVLEKAENWVQDVSSPQEEWPVPMPSKMLQSYESLTACIEASNATLRSILSKALPYAETDDERCEKDNILRGEFPAQEIPSPQDAEKPLVAPNGVVDDALLSPMSNPKENNGTQRSSSSGPSKLASNPPRATNPGGLKATSSSVKPGSSLSKNAEISSSQFPAPAPQQTKRSKSLSDRIQTAAKSAGRRLSLGNNAEKNEKGQGSNVPPTPKSAGFRSMFRTRRGGAGDPSQPADETACKSYEFKVTKETIYISGGDDDTAINPLESLDKSEEAIGSEIETEEGERVAKKPKDAINLLRELQNYKGLTQLTEPGEEMTDMKRWLDCCRFFQIDPNETGVKERVRIVGIQQPLFQYQAFSVYWQMLNSRRFGGGFVADMPGLGKTLVFLSLIVVERQLSLLWDQVNKSRKAKDGKHLPLTGQLVNDVCPSEHERPGWIACPCAFSNPSSQMPAQPGVRIAIIPASLMSNWRNEWKKIIDPVRQDLDMRLLLAHQGSIANHADTKQMADWPANIAILKATKVAKGVDTAKENQEKFLVLTTAQSYDAWIDKFKYGSPRSKKMFKEFNATNTKFFQTEGSKYNIQFGIACVDESHEESTIDKGRAGVMARLPGNPMCWGYSGTPLDKSPRSLEGVLWALEKQAIKISPDSSASGWTQVKELKRFGREAFDKLCKDFESHVKSGKTNAEALGNFEEAFLPLLTTFMIRRTPDTRWFGHRLVALNSNLHRDVFLGHNGKYDEEIKALIPEIEADAVDRLQQLQALWDTAEIDRRALERPTVLGVNNKIHTLYKMRILATCPALIKLTTGENALTLKTDELMKWRGVNEKNSPYVKNLSEIFENSPKLLWLRGCILDLEKQRDVDAAEQKMIIITNFNCIAFILKLMIEQYIPSKKGRVGLIHAEMNITGRTAMLEAFTDAITENKQGAAVRKRKENYQFLIGTTPLLSQGLQLTRACNVVLMEPDHEFCRELQGYARVNRIGQKNPWTFTYRLIDDGSAVEDSILQRQKERGQFPGRDLNGGDLEKMGPMEDRVPVGPSDSVKLSQANTASPDAKQKSPTVEQQLRRANRTANRSQKKQVMSPSPRPKLRRVEGVDDLKKEASLAGQDLT